MPLLTDPGDPKRPYRAVKQSSYRAGGRGHDSVLLWLQRLPCVILLLTLSLSQACREVSDPYHWPVYCVYAVLNHTHVFDALGHEARVRCTNTLWQAAVVSFYKVSQAEFGPEISQHSVIQADGGNKGHFYHHLMSPSFPALISLCHQNLNESASLTGVCCISHTGGSGWEEYYQCLPGRILYFMLCFMAHNILSL